MLEGSNLSPVSNTILLNLPHSHQPTGVSTDKPAARGVPGQAGGGALQGGDQARVPRRVQVQAVDMAAPAGLGLLSPCEESRGGEEEGVLGGDRAQGVALLQPVGGLPEGGLGAVGGEDQVHGWVGPSLSYETRNTHLQAAYEGDF